MRSCNWRLCVLYFASLNASLAFAQATPPADTAEATSTTSDELTEEQIAQILAESEVIEIVPTTPPGSGHAVDSEELERFEHDDIHKILTTVPGVYIREEDGYGLRPNIGMRGSGSERSAKITLMEDGVLIAPAPYAAPAAYYFPLVTRMNRVEVLKGPASIQYGPNTVGGALNLVSRPIPHEGEATLDIAGGSDFYGKTHASIGKSWRNLGFVVEGIKLRSSGFKKLDGGGNTGFDKHDLLAKGRINTEPTSAIYHEVNAKVGYSDEVSNETYTGLADDDFANTPYRRYAGTQLDRLEWDHLQIQLSHRLDLTEMKASLTTTAYRNTFSRDWRKLNGFRGASDLADILNNPKSGNNALFYALLTGQADSSSDAEALVLGTNARDFVSQGVQSIGRHESSWLGITHETEVGLRLHMDEAERFHYEEDHFMSSGDMIRNDSPQRTTKDATGRAFALALHAQDHMQIGDLKVKAGLRTEIIRTQYDNRDNPAENNKGTTTVWIPGLGMTYQVVEDVGLLVGVHKGFAPAAPGPDPDVQAEESINYEAGVRLAKFGLASEVIGFLSNYSNLKGTCTFSTGCMDSQVGDEFNGGKVRVFGIEAQSQGRWTVGPLHVPVKIAYTFNHARFLTSFESSNPQWGDVEMGDVLPYLPTHQVSLHAGVGGKQWELNVETTHTSAMRDVAGQGAVEGTEQTDASTALNLAGNYHFGAWGGLYATVDNVLGQAYIVSRRPYGARPGVPRLVIIGYKNIF